MSPDQHDHSPDDEAADNAVLDDGGNLDTHAIGLLGTSTQQVSVSLPVDRDDDDEDVIDDELPVSGDVAAPAGAAASEAREEDDEIFEGHLETGEQPSVTVDVDVHTAEIVTDAADDIEVGPALVEPARDDVPSRDENGPEAGAAPPTTSAATDPAPSVPRTGSVPTTRREAQHPGETRALDRGEGGDRVTTRADITLSSKRLGEFEPDRETADLLTADRLLDRTQLSRPEPEGYWQQLIYALSGRRINLGDSRKAQARKGLDRRIGAPLPGAARFVPVVSRKGGVGKTTVTALLGMALADARDDRVIAVDANPDRGTLADRIGRTGGRTVRDLARVRGEVSGYSDISAIVARDETRLDVLASDSDPQVSEAFSGRDYHDVASLAAHYYSIVLTDTGTGIVHSVMGATLELADQLVLVAGLSVDEARLASETLTWLETNGYADRVRNAVVVLNSGRPGAPLVQLDQLDAHFRTRVRAVVRMPYDAHIATGSSIVFRDLNAATRDAARELAAVVVEGLRTATAAA